MSTNFNVLLNATVVATTQFEATIFATTTSTAAVQVAAALGAAAAVVVADVATANLLKSVGSGHTGHDELVSELPGACAPVDNASGDAEAAATLDQPLLPPGLPVRGDALIASLLDTPTTVPPTHALPDASYADPLGPENAAQWANPAFRAALDELRRGAKRDFLWDVVTDDEDKTPVKARRSRTMRPDDWEALWRWYEYCHAPDGDSELAEADARCAFNKLAQLRDVRTLKAEEMKKPAAERENFVSGAELAAAIKKKRAREARKAAALEELRRRKEAAKAAAALKKKKRKRKVEANAAATSAKKRARLGEPETSSAALPAAPPLPTPPAILPPSPSPLSIAPPVPITTPTPTPPSIWLAMANAVTGCLKRKRGTDSDSLASAPAHAERDISTPAQSESKDAVSAPSQSVVDVSTSKTQSGVHTPAPAGDSSEERPAKRVRMKVGQKPRPRPKSHPAPAPESKSQSRQRNKDKRKQRPGRPQGLRLDAAAFPVPYRTSEAAMQTDPDPASQSSSTLAEEAATAPSQEPSMPTLTDADAFPPVRSLPPPRKSALKSARAPSHGPTRTPKQHHARFSLYSSLARPPRAAAPPQADKVGRDYTLDKVIYGRPKPLEPQWAPPKDAAGVTPGRVWSQPVARYRTYCDASAQCEESPDAEETGAAEELALEVDDAALQAAAAAWRARANRIPKSPFKSKSWTAEGKHKRAKVVFRSRGASA